MEGGGLDSSSSQHQQQNKTASSAEHQSSNAATMRTCTLRTDKCAPELLSLFSKNNMQQAYLTPQGDFKFPIKLHYMLEEVHREGTDTKLVSWSPDGTSFRVHKPALFERNILPRYFTQTKYRSFQRQLNHYGFHRIVRSPPSSLFMEGGYWHPDFFRDDPTRCHSMRRLKKIKKGKNQQQELEDEDDGSHLGGTTYHEECYENRPARPPTLVAPVSPEPEATAAALRGILYDDNNKATRIPRENPPRVTFFPSPSSSEEEGFLYRPLPHYLEARGSLTAPAPQVYYHEAPPPPVLLARPPPPPPPQPFSHHHHVTHVYYVSSPAEQQEHPGHPDSYFHQPTYYHHQHPPPFVKYHHQHHQDCSSSSPPPTRVLPPAVVSPAPPARPATSTYYHQDTGGAAVPPLGPPMAPSLVSPTTATAKSVADPRPLMGMVPEDEEDEADKRARQTRQATKAFLAQEKEEHSKGVINLPTSKSLDDLLMELMSDQEEDHESHDDVDEDELVLDSRKTSGRHYSSSGSLVSWANHHQQSIQTVAL
jgi:hypothetical protein